MTIPKKILFLILFILAAIDFSELSYDFNIDTFFLENAIYTVIIFLIFGLTIIQEGILKYRNVEFIIIFLTLVIISFFAKQTLDADSLSSILRFSIPFLLIRLKITDLKPFIAKLILILPFLSLLLGIGMMIVGVNDIYLIEYTGAFRLKGAKCSAHLALLCIPAILLILFELSGEFSRRMVYYGLGILVVLFLTFTRTPIALVLLILSVFVLKRIHYKRYRNILFIAFIAFISLAFTQGDNIYDVFVKRSITKDGLINDSGRSTIWLLCTSKIAEQPYLGYGGGESSNYLSTQSKYFKSPHNEFLHYAFDYGVVGLLFITGLIISILNGILFKETKFFIYLTIFVLSVTDNPLSTMAFQVPFFLMINLIRNSDVRK